MQAAQGVDSSEVGVVGEEAVEVEVTGGLQSHQSKSRFEVGGRVGAGGQAGGQGQDPSHSKL